MFSAEMLTVLAAPRENPKKSGSSLVPELCLSSQRERHSEGWDRLAGSGAVTRPEDPCAA